MPKKDRRHFYPRPDAKAADGLWLYGLHAVRAALANPRRKLKRAVLTARAAEEMGAKLLGRVRHEIADGDAVARLLPPGAVHQGVALSCEPLARRDLEDALTLSPDVKRPDRSGREVVPRTSSPSALHLAGGGNRRRIVLVLDQISDPHNAGAILRSAAAFGVSAVVAQDRHAPPENGALAKAASGALDIVPVVTVVNIARALEQLGQLGFWRVALAGDGEAPLKDVAGTGDVALVLGSEGSGIRRLVRERCDAAAFVPIDPAMESLNVSNATAIALYELRRG
jgi:23S rRNA (guanosine2251-2'-O)-methyltransferase